MIGMGTIANVAAIVGGGLLGMGIGRFLKDEVLKSILSACGLMVLFLGMGGALSQMLKIEDGALTTGGSMMMICSLVIGTLIGELLKLEEKIESFGEWLKKKSGNERDAAFTDAFVTATLVVCIGAMAIIGSIQDGIYGDPSILYTKAILDLIYIVPVTASLGKGVIFSAIPVGIWEGLLTICARGIAPIMTDAAMANLSFVGNILIFAVGVNILWPKKIRIANMLPALVIAVAWAFLPI